MDGSDKKRIWLSPHLVTPQRFSDVVRPALVYPTGPRTERMLIVPVDNGSTIFSVFLSGENIFHSFESQRANAWKALMAGPLEFEVDLNSIYDLDRNYSPPGSVVRTGDRLDLITRHTPRGGFSHTVPVTLSSGLPASAPDHEIGFLRWKAGVRQNDELVELFAAAVEIQQSGD